MSDDADEGRGELGALRRRIEELERENARLRETESLARSVVENAPDLIVRTSLDGTLEFVNRSVSGVGVDKAVGRSVLEYVPPEAHDLVRTTFERVVATGAFGDYDCPAPGPNGTVAHYHTRVSPIRDGGRIVGLALLATDVTRLKETERALQRSDENLRFALGASGLGLWSWDLRENRVTWDATTCALYGTDSAPPSYEEFLERIHPQDRERCKAAIARALRTGTYRDIEHRIVRPDRTIRWILAKAKVVRGEGGEIERLVGGILDVTERRMLEEQLRHAQKMEAIGQMSAGIAHNFNNALATIVPSVEAAAKNAEPTSAALLEAAGQAAHRAAAMVRELMLLAGKSRVPRSRKPERIDAIVARTVEMCRTTFAAEATLALEIGPGLPTVTADAGQIEQALLNVLLNARDAVAAADEARRAVRVIVERLEPDDVVHVVGAAPVAHVAIRVVDEGCGMDEETRRRAFEPFFTTKDVGKGTGLGLATTYGIVRDHGGFVTCCSTLGVGTTVRIALPASSSDPREARDVEPSPSLAAR